MSGIPRRTGFLETDGERLYYEVCGEGEPVVLCHGLGGNHAVWYQQVAALAPSRVVVSWDHRGFGRSTDRATRSGPDVATRDLLALLDHLEIRRADLVGQSMGGWTVLGVALEAPERARRLVLADSLGGITSPAIAALQPGGITPPPAELGLHPALHPDFSAREPERAHLYQMLGAMGNPDVPAIAGRLLACTHTEEEARSVTAPTLFVVGDEDPLFPPPEIHAGAALLPDARVVELPDTGHSPYFEDPTAWNEAVQTFLSAPF
ncbi:MAG: alpha/beta hydrolase [Myxococcales bacterium]|nr:alpha/beta hydrolase [Myxococcales bacterium]